MNLVGFDKDMLTVKTIDGRFFILCEDLTFTRKNGEQITIRAGTTTDGASVPRILWTEFPPFGSYWKAAVLHDYLYRVTNKPKPICDDILLEAMETLNVPLFQREAIYLGVKHFGSKAFDKDRVK